MSGTYSGVLPSVFPWRAMVPASKIGEIASVLAERGLSAPNGSSFAVTSDAPRSDFRWLWLSEASFKYMTWYHSSEMTGLEQTGGEEL
jgi:hypothetical protein